MKVLTKKVLLMFMALALLFSLTACAKDSASPDASPAPALSGTLNVLATSEVYVTLFEKFTSETGVKVEFLSMSSGEVLSKLTAEGGVPMADLWFGGGIDAFMQAKEEALLEQMEFEALNDFAPGFIDPDHFWISKGVTVVGFIVNNDILSRKNLPAPQSWDDLINPIYKGEILMSNPAISGTNYAVVNAILQKKGDGAGWKYFEALNKNIDYYSKRGKDPLTKTSASEVGIGITPLDRGTEKEEAEQNLTIIYPTDGIPYVPEGVAVFKNAANVKNAMAFVEWLFSNDENLILLADLDGKDTVKMVKPNINGLTLSFDVNTLMDEDLSLFGSKRTEILDKWNVMMGDKAEQ